METFADCLLTPLDAIISPRHVDDREETMVGLKEKGEGDSRKVAYHFVGVVMEIRSGLAERRHCSSSRHQIEPLGLHFSKGQYIPSS